MIGIHIRLDLEDKAGDLRIAWDNVGLGRRPGRGYGFGRRSIGAQTGQQLIYAEMAQGRSEEDRRHVAFQEGLGIKGL